MTKAFSGKRRFLALWFPYLSADRWRRAGNAAPADGVVFTQKQRGALRIVATDEGARTHLGLALADARARVPDLMAVDHDPVADQQLLDRLADACDRFTPMVALDEAALTLDITGCPHGGGEAGLVEEIEHWAARAGLQLRHALASTPEAAQALARFQSVPATDEKAAVLRLPIAALRSDDDTDLALRRAGLKTISDLAGRPSAPLAARFGAETTDMLARLLGKSDSRISPRRAEPALLFERRFAEPIAQSDYALAVLGELAGEAGEALLERHKGGRRFAARLYRSDGMVRDLAVEASLPLRDSKAVMRLFAERLESLNDPIDPGFGFDLIRLVVPVLEPLAPTQLQLEGGAVAAGELAALIDRLSARGGRNRFRRLRARDTHIPEQAVFALPAIDAPEPALWQAPEIGEPPLRPIHLFDPPQSIEVVAEVPDGPPHRFRWRRTLHEVTRFEGPERIAAEWWKRAGGPSGLGAGLTRDYYRVEDARGRRFWIFRHGLYGAEKINPGWYMHGLFA
ncbi:DNA polymerase Y family protein [Sphingomonas sp. 28-63-12]|uniref:Y-family DNA polymerase n=1 Tax=Sphingomonas sp. 28-63-12 TaxID=1970434 RepID=UPI000BD5FAF5|nr:MAG: nucleotidyltransferase [Sphingomonas sp. 28-63-12]